MGGSERGSNPPGEVEGASRKRDAELDNTLPDGGPDLPAAAGDNDNDNKDIKPQLKSTMMGIDPSAAAKLKELAAAADAARAAAQARRKAEKEARVSAAEVKPSEASAAEGEAPEPKEAPEAKEALEAKAAPAAMSATNGADAGAADQEDAEEEEDEFEASTAMVDPQTQKELLEKVAETSEPGDADAADAGSAEAAGDVAEAAEGEAAGDEAAEAAEDEGAEAADDQDAEAADAHASEAAAATDDEDDDEDEDEDEDVEEAGIRVDYYGRTDVGLIREHNEDNFTVVDVGRDIRDVEDTPRVAAIGERGAVFAVCDGMGGAAAGEVASQMAVDTVYEYFSAMGVPKSRDHFAQRVSTSIEEAGNRIFSAAKMDRTRRGMGTTATVAGLIDKVLFVGQVGDSRAYVLRGGELGLITKDQSLVNQLIEAGQLTEEEAEAFEHSNIILQALGTTEEVTVDLTFIELRKGDRLMMCSDGLSGLVHPDLIKDVMAGTADLVACCDKLIEMANAGGGHDNITVVCVDFDGDDLAEPEEGNKPMYVQYPLPPGLEEERESLLPREPQMKSGGKKPGADVKRASDDTPPGSPHARSNAVGAPINWGVVLGALVVAAVITAVALAMQNDDEPEPEPAPDNTQIVPSSTEVEQQIVEEETDVEVHITTDIDGELFINGERYGAIADGDRLLVMLPPGAYRFEAMSGDDIVAEEVVTVNADEPLDVSLALPAGAVDAIEAEGQPAPNEPTEPEGESVGGQDEGTEAEAEVGDEAGGAEAPDQAPSAGAEDPAAGN